MKRKRRIRNIKLFDSKESAYARSPVPQPPTYNRIIAVVKALSKKVFGLDRG